MTVQYFASVRHHVEYGIRPGFVVCFERAGTYVAVYNHDPGGSDKLDLAKLRIEDEMREPPDEELREELVEKLLALWASNRPVKAA
jgi:hypothetical protein